MAGSRPWHISAAAILFWILLSRAVSWPGVDALMAELWKTYSNLGVCWMICDMELEYEDIWSVELEDNLHNLIWIDLKSEFVGLMLVFSILFRASWAAIINLICAFACNFYAPCFCHVWTWHHLSFVSFLAGRICISHFFLMPIPTNIL